MIALKPFDSQWFRARLKEVGKTQVDLATRMECTPGNVSRMLSGSYAIDLEDVAVLAEVLQVSRAEIIERAGLPLDCDSDSLSQPKVQSHDQV